MSVLKGGHKISLGRLESQGNLLKNKREILKVRNFKMKTYPRDEESLSRI